MSSNHKSLLENLTQSVLFQKISDICDAVNQVGDPEELFDTSLKRTMELFGASRCSIYVISESGKELMLKAAHGLGEANEARVIKHIDEGIIGYVAQSKKPIFVEDIAQDDRFKRLKARKNYKTPSFICAPLILKDKLIGVINITDKYSGHRFNKEETELLDFLASQIALNYQRIQLYQRFKKVIAEAEDLKHKLGKSDQETAHLKKQIIIKEKLATLGKLAGGIAHEFNNPLDGVMRYTNLCLEHTKDDEVVRGYLLEIKQGLNRMANIVRNLLACSRNEKINDEKVDFNAALDRVLMLRQTDLDGKNITVERNIDENIPSIRDLGLEQVLSNLIRNAIDAVGRDGKVVIQAKYYSGILVFEISDTGCGIPSGKIDEIFEPFYTTKDIDKGCGLGLTIVGEIVKNYNGSINVESRQGEGTTFTIHIPVDEKVNEL